jgi:outer membrane murein-binding lipoprotein Lpp
VLLPFLQLDKATADAAEFKAGYDKYAADAAEYKAGIDKLSADNAEQQAQLDKAEADAAEFKAGYDKLLVDTTQQRAQVGAAGSWSSAHWDTMQCRSTGPACIAAAGAAGAEILGCLCWSAAAC